MPSTPITQGPLGPLSSGNHTFTITATDATGAVATPLTGTFAVTGPTISSVNVNLTAPIPVITWNVASSVGIAGTSITVDGNPLFALYGPFGNIFNANYSGAIGGLPRGNHTFTYLRDRPKMRRPFRSPAHLPSRRPNTTCPGPSSQDSARVEMRMQLSEVIHPDRILWVACTEVTSMRLGPAA